MHLGLMYAALVASGAITPDGRPASGAPSDARPNPDPGPPLAAVALPPSDRRPHGSLAEEVASASSVEEPVPAIAS